MRIPLLAGREFTDQDREKSPPVIIINDQLKQRFWSDEDPLGRHISIVAERGVSREIVGVATNVKHATLDSETEFQTYVPCLQKPFNFMALVVNTSGDPATTASGVRSEVLGVDDSQPVYDIRPMKLVVSDSVSQQRVNMMLLIIFAAVGLILSCVGIYAMMNYAVSQRTHEIGIRMALGASSGDILKMILRQGMVLVTLGVMIGLVLASWLGRLAETLLFGVSAHDPMTFIVIPVVLSVVALVACAVPARRATAVDPVIALREE